MMKVPRMPNDGNISFFICGNRSARLDAPVISGNQIALSFESRTVIFEPCIPIPWGTHIKPNNMNAPIFPHRHLGTIDCRITPAGLEMMSELDRPVDEMNRRVLNSLTSAETTRLIGLLERVNPDG